MQIAKEETKGRTINFEQLVRTLFTSELRKTAGRVSWGPSQKWQKLQSVWLCYTTSLMPLQELCGVGRL